MSKGKARIQFWRLTSVPLYGASSRPTLVDSTVPLRRSRKPSPAMCSPRPRPYCGAVSTKLMPASTAARTVARASSSGTSTNKPAMLAVPSDSSVTSSEVLPTRRFLNVVIRVLRQNAADTDMLVAGGKAGGPDYFALADVPNLADVAGGADVVEGALDERGGVDFRRP